LAFRQRVLEGLGYAMGGGADADPVFQDDPVWAGLQDHMAKHGRVN
jgi:hypothetical protein